MCTLFPETINEMKLKRTKYRDKRKRFLLKILDTIHYFHDLKPATIEELFYALKTEFYERGYDLLVAGDCLDKIRIIVDGEVDVVVKMDSGE